MVLTKRSAASGEENATRTATSRKVHHWKSSDLLRIRNDYSAHAQKTGPFLRSRFLVLIKKSAPLGTGMGPSKFQMYGHYDADEL